jgi:hypothetical protein
MSFDLDERVSLSSHSGTCQASACVSSSLPIRAFGHNFADLVRMDVFLGAYF